MDRPPDGREAGRSAELRWTLTIRYRHDISEPRGSFGLPPMANRRVRHARVARTVAAWTAKRMLLYCRNNHSRNCQIVDLWLDNGEAALKSLRRERAVA